MRMLAGIMWKLMYSRKLPSTSLSFVLVESQYFLLHISAAFENGKREGKGNWD